MDLPQQGMQGVEKEVCNKLEGGGSPSWEQLQSLHHSIHPLELSGRAELSEQFHEGKGQSSDFQSYNPSPVAMEVSVTHGDDGACPAAGSESSWRSRSWSSTGSHRAGPAGSGRSWQDVAGPRTLCSGPQRGSQQLQPSRRGSSCKYTARAYPQVSFPSQNTEQLPAFSTLPVLRGLL